jgi:hypothetical protein
MLMVLDSEEVGRTRFLGLGIDVWLDFENLLLVVVKEGLREGLYLRLRCGNKLECKNYEDLMRAGSVLLNIIILHHPTPPAHSREDYIHNHSLGFVYMAYISASYFFITSFRRTFKVGVRVPASMVKSSAIRWKS